MPSTFCITVSGFNQYPPHRVQHVVSALRCYGLRCTLINQESDLVLEGPRRVLPVVHMLLVSLEYETLNMDDLTHSALTHAAELYAQQVM